MFRLVLALTLLGLSCTTHPVNKDPTLSIPNQQKFSHERSLDSLAPQSELSRNRSLDSLVGTIRTIKPEEKGFGFCSICLDEISDSPSDSEFWRHPDCTNVFCKICIKTWVDQGGKCPICRKECNIESMSKILEKKLYLQATGRLFHDLFLFLQLWVDGRRDGLTLENLLESRSFGS